MADDPQAQQPVTDLVVRQQMELPLPAPDDFDTTWGEIPHFAINAVNEDLTAAAVEAEHMVNRGETAVGVIHVEQYLGETTAEFVDRQITEMSSIDSDYPDDAFFTDDVDLMRADRDIEQAQHDEYAVLYRLVDNLYEAIDDESEEVYRFLDIEMEAVWEAFDTDRAHFERELQDLREDQDADAAFFERRILDWENRASENDDEMWRHAIAITDNEADITALRSALAHRDGVMMRMLDVQRTLAQHIDRLDWELAEVKGDVEKGRQRISGQAEVLVSYSEAMMGALGDQYLATEAVDKRIDAADHRIDDVERHVDDTDYRVNRRIDQHGDGLARLWEEHNVATTVQDSMRVQVNHLTDTSLNHEDRIEREEDRLDEIRTELSAVMH